MEERELAIHVGKEEGVSLSTKVKVLAGEVCKSIVQYMALVYELYVPENTL
jgi:hypothetical protein